MKSKFFLFALSLSLLSAACAVAQVDNSAERKDRIKANLYFLFPQLAEHSVVLEDLAETETPGLQSGRFVVNGQQQQPFLTTSDDKQFYLVAGGPFDVSKTGDELAEAQAEREAEAAQKAKEIHVEMLPLVENMPHMGAAEAPVTIIEFSDFQCPYCARAAETIHEVVEKYPEDVRLIYVQFPLESIHPWARSASIASLCAADQSVDAFWTLHDSFFENQKELDSTNVIENSRTYLAGSNLDMDTWSSCASDESSEAYQNASARVDASLQLGAQHGINSTPGFFVNGQFVSGAQPIETFEELIEKAKAGM